MAAVTLVGWMLDGLIGIGLVWLAWRSLSIPSPFAAVVLFVAFGLLLALAWVRLNSPDVALAEAAIGAGLTGALLLDATARLEGGARGSSGSAGERARSRAIVGPLAAAATWLLVCGLATTLLILTPRAVGLSSEVTRKLEASGVSNPVTAVLLNFRGYDTLLETAVLLVALIGAASSGAKKVGAPSFPGPVLENFARFLAPLAILVSGYLLWVGAYAPGGAFQAGAVLAAMGVVMVLSARGRGQWPRWSFRLRLLLALGPAAFVVTAAITLATQGGLLEYPPRYAGVVILILETAATLSIGATLLALFSGLSFGQRNER
ncbi:MAG: hydrogenase subunit MbhD domain-containing protein [Salinisphaera sp.]|uniref:hydrogenase subunit MbhD domain-containing protein n=1 Tax=Salinisphaera sp. TaxID=1914330 RepID=UPI003C7CAB0E